MNLAHVRVLTLMIATVSVTVTGWLTATYVWFMLTVYWTADVYTPTPSTPLWEREL